MGVRTDRLVDRLLKTAPSVERMVERQGKEVSDFSFGSAVLASLLAELYAEAYGLSVDESLGLAGVAVCALDSEASGRRLGHNIMDRVDGVRRMLRASQGTTEGSGSIGIGLLAAAYVEEDGEIPTLERVLEKVRELKARLTSSMAVPSPGNN